MKLQFLKRSAEKKSEANRLRREGNIPAVIYHRGKNAENISVKSSEFSSQLRAVQPGRLSTQVFELTDENGKVKKAIIKDIQYNVVNYNVVHLDFEELQDNVEVNVKVPIECIGTADCPGIKLGGSLRQVIRNVRVRCLPKDIPAAFIVNVKEMGIKDVRRLGDLEIPNTIRPLASLKEVAIAIVKR